jgi:murein DD-endopeptidase MepM/ murein hydrolase activator NlpD
MSGNQMLNPQAGMPFRDVPAVRSTRGFLAAMLAVVAVAAASCAHVPRGLPASAYIPSGWPTAPNAHTITSAFGSRSGRLHAGVDIAAPRKSQVVATACGRVTYTGRDRGGYGKHVIIHHGNGYETLYAHLSRIKTKQGKRVKRGEVIGRVGKTGNASGPHVHYEIRQNGKPTDPAPFLP